MYNVGQEFSKEEIWDVLEIPMNADIPETMDLSPEMADFIENQHPVRGLYRDDTGQFIAGVGPSYHVVQNSRLYEIIEGALKVAGLQESAVRYREFGRVGNRVSFQVRMADWAGLGESNSGTRRWLTVINSFDGSTSVGIGSTGVTIVCGNAFFSAYSQLANKIRHTASAEENIQALGADLIEGVKREVREFERMELYSKTEIDSTFTNMVVKEILGYNLQTLLNQKSQLTDRQFNARSNKLNRFGNSLKIELPRQGRTCYGLFCAVTHYLTHNVKANMKKHDAIQYATVGGGKVILERVTELLNNYCGHAI